MTPPDSPAPTTRRRAAAALGLSGAADGPAARAAFLRRLAGEGFVPPEEQVAAVNALAGTDAPVTPDTAAGIDADIGDEVDAFVADYWDLPPSVRRARWEDLSARCRDESSGRFLNHLGAGIDLAVHPRADEDEEALAGVFRELFLLRPRARAVRRAEWMAEWGKDPVRRAAADRIRDTDPDVAGLDPVLFSLLDSVYRPASIPAVDPEVLAREAAREAAARERAERRRNTRQPEKQPTSNGGGGWAGFGGLGWAGAVIIGIIIKGLVAVTRDPPKPQYTPPPYYQTNNPQNQFGRPWSPQPGKDDTNAKTSKLIDQLKKNSGKPTPPPGRQ